ncbi:MAG: TIGR03915 family putative DNA repair protein, partial [Clostridiales Family XIII bacterium]|nr:TIGR03915 family putative DNA repair protein [Clostridiales Family XIII bacterium]
ILFAKVTPDHDVLEFLAQHFCDRFKNDPFLIWDTRREKALVAFQKRWYITALSAETIRNDVAFRPSTEELSYRALWKRYFDTIAIRERTNAKCQKSFMPVRYWGNLPEMKMNPNNL